MESLKLNANNLSTFSNVAILPRYDRSKIRAGIIHVGIGGFHRAHQAYYTDQLLHAPGNEEWGICGIALLDFDEKIYRTLKEQDGLYTLVVKELDGSLTKTIVGSIVEYLFAPENPTAVIEKMANEATKIITLTITEGGYNYNEATKQFDFDKPLIQHDLQNPSNPKTIFGYLTQALILRQARNLKGLSIQSCDNIEGNGHMMQKMLLSFVQKAHPDLVSWIQTNVSFPNSMVDRITPATTQEEIDKLRMESGIEDAWPVVCEPYKQWVIEDDFISGRPAWEKVGAQFVDDVLPYEKMKLSLLNAGHSVLGILGALMGFETIDQALANQHIRTLLRIYMDIEVSPLLGDLDGIDLTAYKDSLLQRFGNVYIRDQVERICAESSSKIPIFILPTVNAQLKGQGRIEIAALVIAAWAIYNLGFDEKGKSLKIVDAMYPILKEKAEASNEEPMTFLKIESIFGKLNISTRFAQSYTKAYKSIKAIGVESSVMEIINSNQGQES